MSVCTHGFAASACPDCRYQEGFEDALEAAAKWATDHLTHGNYEWVGEGIRALKVKKS